MATPKKTLVITVQLTTYSAKVALKDAQAVVDRLDDLLPNGTTLKGVNVR